MWRASLLKGCQSFVGISMKCCLAFGVRRIVLRFMARRALGLACLVSSIHMNVARILYPRVEIDGPAPSQPGL